MVTIIIASIIAGYVVTQTSKYSPLTALLLSLGFIVLIIILGLRIIRRNNVSQGLDVLAPDILFPLLYCTYFGFGSLNISSLRGYIPPSICLYYILGLLGYFAGIGTVRILSKLRKSTNCQINTKSSLEYADTWSKKKVRKSISLFIMIGTIGVSLAFYLYGVPLLGIYKRFGVSAYFSYVATLLWLGAYLSFFHSMSSRGRGTLGNALLILYAFTLLLLLGYRTPIIMCLLNIIFSTYYIKFFKFRKKRLLMVSLGGILIVLFGSVFWYLRYDVLGEGMGYNRLIKSVGYPSQLSFLFPFYAASRGSVNSFYRFLQLIPHHYNFFYGKLLLTDFWTILPGKQVSGGAIVSNMVGGTGKAGITASILGGLYVDFGKAGIFGGLYLLGFGAKWLYQRMRIKMTRLNIILYCYFLAFSIHYLHRGIFKPVYVMHFVILILFSRLVEKTASRQARTRPINLS